MFEEYKTLLTEFVKLKTVSSDSSQMAEFIKTMAFFSKILEESKFTTQVFYDYGHPIFFAEYEVDPRFPTCLIYGHYDVQPAEKSDGWNSNPFEVIEKDGKLFGRGTMDDKGQLLMHMLVIKHLIKNNELRYNIKFISEGEEEIGSPHIERFIEEHKELLKADFIMLSDGELMGTNPTIELGFRGIVNGELTIITATNDLHSGLYGGVAPNAAHVASKFIHDMHDELNNITVEGFYDNVDKITYTSPINYDVETYKKNTGAKALHLQKGMDIYTQVGLMPAFNIVGMWSGYIGEGIKTAIPSKATIKFNTRIVQRQTPEEVEDKLRKHVKKMLPDFVEYDLVINEKAYPAKVEKENVFLQKASDVLTKIFGSEPTYKYDGGTEPVIAYFAKHLGYPQAIIPFANEDGHMHGIDENFEISYIKKGLEFSKEFFGTK